LPKPRIFISHNEKNREPTDYTIRLLRYLGCSPIIAEEMPHFNRTVSNLVDNSMEACDAVIVIATPDMDGTLGKSPSQGVLVEIGKIQNNEKFKGKYFIIKEETVILGPMIPEARYKFSLSNFGPIAEAVLIELGSMGFFKNYYEMKGSELKIHELIETLAQLKELFDKNVFDKQEFKQHSERVIQEMIGRVLGERP
jgi:hypothetical protein